MTLNSMPLTTAKQIMMVGIILWTSLNIFLYHNRVWWKAINAICLCGAVFGILYYSVIGRAYTDNHQFVWYVQNHEDPIWEMGMNAFLYYPLGLSLTTFTGGWTILIGFLISASIESWQYITGSGLAQGTDVIMNTLGCAIGTIPWFNVRFGVVEKIVTLIKKTAVWMKNRKKQ